MVFERGECGYTRVRERQRVSTRYLPMDFTVLLLRLKGCIGARVALDRYGALYLSIPPCASARGPPSAGRQGSRPQASQPLSSRSCNFDCPPLQIFLSSIPVRCPSLAIKKSSRAGGPFEIDCLIPIDQIAFRHRVCEPSSGHHHQCGTVTSSGDRSHPALDGSAWTSRRYSGTSAGWDGTRDVRAAGNHRRAQDFVLQ